ncbi:aminopeptidase N [Corynebacterium bovis]|uniref:aminopeptidase N n=1 Tax=Corynebacterium bovis TaxID=36808 RepID=UPI000F651EE4|nr:aminopeptidase N [Corynebacterium bovis]RRO81090.1 aminopeptidase N [Corynebacterium bovis]RRO89840.1 aminopeptidase N [Corynebacterium bovis]RRQ13670.1 aminopeptidase N [Corynebacterium bovis]RRQ16005.1 aminopeptidase N [Corynebacterium bovis]
MSSTNLTRTEAAGRASLITGVHYSIRLDLTAGADPERATFPSTTSVTFTVTDPADGGEATGTGTAGASTFIDLIAADVPRVTLDGRDITDAAVPRGADGAYDASRGLLLEGLTPGEHDLEVTAECVYSTTGEGLHRFRDPADDRVYMYTQFETADAKRVFACFDQPDIKATYDVAVRTPGEWTVVTNNTVTTRTDGEGAEGGQGDDDRSSVVTSTATVDYPLSTYLVAFCVGPWHVVRDEWRGTLTPHPETAELHTDGEITVPLAVFCRRSLAGYLDEDEIFSVTKAGFDYYHRHFGVAYPFHKYDQVFCPEYNMGAMENAGCVTIRDEYIFRSAASHYQHERRADTILHELAHMWFGDLVTMRWWDDLWLNESFATWSAAMSQANATEWTTAWVTFANKEKAWAYSQDQLPSTHPIFSGAEDIEEADANFDGITYAKGASVLKQLAAYVGLDAFFAGVRAHFAAHAWVNATFDDLLGALEEASGRDLSGWADEWLRTTGVTTFSADTETAPGDDGAEVYTRFTVVQSGAQPGAGETRTHRAAVGLYDGHDGTVTLRRRVEIDVTGERTDVPALVGEAPADLVILNDDDLTYTLLDLDPRSLATAVEHISGIADPMARSQVWSTAWQMTRDAKMRARDFVALVVRGAAAETEMAVLEQIIAQGVAAVEGFAAPTWAPEGWAELRRAYLDGARSTTGTAQLAFIRGFIRCVHDSASADVLRALLDRDGDAVPGLTVDQDLRWSVIGALAGAETSAVVSPDEVEELVAAEEKADRSAAGALAALHARSSLPRVKEDVWEKLSVHGPEWTNRQLEALVSAFVRNGHAEALQPFGPLYVAEVVRMWRSLSPEMAQRTLDALYPVWDNSGDTAAGVDRLITDDATPSGLRRVLTEGRDRARRRAAARAVDAGESAR